MASRETSPGILMFAVGINLFNIGMFVGRMAGENRANAPERIEAIQAHNAELQEQLLPDYGTLGKLVLNDDTNTFEFRISPEGEQPQTCEGEYKVVDNYARLSGNIACTTTVQVGGN